MTIEHIDPKPDAEAGEPAEASATTTKRGGISRRTMIGAAAWSAPIIAIAAASPAAAASGVVSQIQLINDSVGMGNTLYGRVTDSEGNGVAGAGVAFVRLIGPIEPVASTTFADPNGFFYAQDLYSVASDPLGEEAEVRITSQSVSRDFRVLAYPDF